MKHVQIAPSPGAQNDAQTSGSAEDPAAEGLAPEGLAPDDPGSADIAEALIAMARARRAGATFCPSEAARALSPSDWRPLMPRVRDVAARLQRDGLLRVTQGGRAVDPLSAGGPIRLSRPTH